MINFLKDDFYHYFYYFYSLVLKPIYNPKIKLWRLS